jgi:hypothetical protein
MPRVSTHEFSESLAQHTTMATLTAAYKLAIAHDREYSQLTKDVPRGRNSRSSKFCRLS